MIRTQIHLANEELELLDRAARETGASRSALIRRAVRETFGRPVRRPPLTSFGVAPELALDPDEIDTELARIYEERARRWQG